MSFLDTCCGDKRNLNWQVEADGPPGPPSGSVSGHSRFHLGLFIAGVVVRKLHIKNPLHEEDGIGVEIQVGVRLPHHRVVGVWVQEDSDIPAPHQHLGSWQARVRRTAMNSSSSQRPGASPALSTGPVRS